MIDSVTLDETIELHVDAYERALAAGEANLEDYLPGRDDPKFFPVLAELIRVDLELSWDAGQKKSVSDYFATFPELTNDPLLRREVAYEEYRQRRQHGEVVTIAEFTTKYDIDSTDWTTVVSAQDETTATPEDFDSAIPTSGERWREFEVIEEIGRGALSRVLLARQLTLSGRLVVLKFAPQHVLEAEKLAKLQHPNIVTVFSVYEHEDLHVFCMPYLGRRTLVDRLAGKDSSAIAESDVLHLALKMSEAVSHAHQRGVLHNDIKPANVLIGDDNEPMLLDFNLAANTALPDAIANVGGTIPYMSPESLLGLARGKHQSNEQSDVYSLGVLLFELVTRQQAFGGTGNVQEAMDARNHPPTDDRFRCMSPGLAAIIRQCIALDPADRYRTADELRDDISCQLTDRPLRFAPNTSLKERVMKWCRRHPRITSSTSIAVVAATLVVFASVAWLSREHHIDQLEASNQFTVFRERVDELVPRLSAIGLDVVDVDRTVAEAEDLLALYARGDQWRQAKAYKYLSPSDKAEVDLSISKLAWLTASGHMWLAEPNGTSDTHLAAAAKWNAWSGDGASQDRKSHVYQLARLKHLTNQADAEDMQERARVLEPVDADDLQLVGWLAKSDGDHATALTSFRSACRQAPRDSTKWFDLARAHAEMGEWQEAEACLTTSLALRPESHYAAYCRGLARHELGNYSGAIADYSRFLEAVPNNPHALLNRAIAHKSAGDHELALADIDRAISQGLHGTRVLIIRSRVLRLLGDSRGASQNMREALAATPRDEKDWVARGTAVMQRRPERALDDFRQALVLNPQSHAARRNIAYVLSERLQRTDEAIDCLDQLLVHHRDDPAAYAGRGVLLARVGKYDEAIVDAQRVVELNGGHRTLLQAACIYALASKDRPELKGTAIALLGASFKISPDLVKLARNDADLRDIHGLEEFRELCEVAQKMAEIPAAKAAIQMSPN